ncbi:MAG: restriction endonuclease subunit S [Flavobacteriaceae bacterium]|nr:restriction endonuclease subunit S [Flavobacteriaceae bacterium]
MNDWQESTLGDIANIIMGQSPKSEFYNLDGIGLPFYQGVTEFNDKYVSIKNYTSKNTKVVEDNTILFSVRAPVGRINFTKQKCCIGRGNAGLIMKNGNQDFLYFLLLFLERKLQDYTSGTIFSSISGKELNKIPVIIPRSTNEQKSIANVLTAFDDKIELLQQQNTTLETIAQTIFKEWFGKYQLGDDLPEGWRVGKLGDFKAVIADFVANGSFASLKENVTLYDYPEYALFMRNTDLKSDFMQKTYVDKRAYEFLSKTKLFGGEIIISNVGDVGSVHFCPYFDMPMTLGNNVIMLKSKYQFYFYTLFNSRIGQHLIGSITGGSAQPKFNKTDFRNMGMIIPSQVILDNFENIASKLYNKLLENKKQIQSLTKTRDTLLPKLMSGQVRVNM